MGIPDYSTTPSSNTAINAIGVQGTNKPSNFDNAFRQIMADLATFTRDGGNLASASTLNLDNVKTQTLTVTGTTATTSITLTDTHWRIVTAAAAWPITAGADLQVNGSTSVSYTCTAGDRLLIQAYGSSPLVRVTLIGQGAGTAPIITPWTSYSPTFTGFGTAASVSMWWKRVGDTLKIRGYFTTGTCTLTEARISLPNSVTSDATKVPAIQQAGGRLIQNAASSSFIYPLIESNVAYMTFGVQDGTAAGLSKVNASSVFSSSRQYAFHGVEIPISGW